MWLKMLSRKFSLKNTTKCKRFVSNWKQPEGYNTNIKIYNPLEQKTVPFVVKNKNFVTWYTCGPTVYDSAHIGHASCYMRLDILLRILKNYFQLNIVSIMNITDVDDKIIKRSLEEKKSPKEISEFYENEFWEDMSKMGIEKPDKVIRVTENMDLILEFIEKLLNEGNAYKSNDGSVYFDVEKYNENYTYGKLNKYVPQESAVEFKKNAADFALWKSPKENEIFWDSKFGPGRPGWHIECSALAGTLLGSNIDVHCGGIDLRFPHHENEEAQSCAFFKVHQWVNYWIHTGHLHLPNSEKMSKSLKNTLSISSLLKQYDPSVFRMACLLTSYQRHMEYNEEVLINAESMVRNFKNFFDTTKMHLSQQKPWKLNVDKNMLQEKLNETILIVDKCLKNDFDTCSSIQAINNLAHVTKKSLHEASSNALSTTDGTDRENNMVIIAILNYIENIMDKAFGMDFFTSAATKDMEEFSRTMDLLVNFRHQLRIAALTTKNRELLSLCDDVRTECQEKLGVNIKDHAKISTWIR